MLKKNLPQITLLFIKLLSELSRRDKDILVKRFVKNLSLEEVAKEYNITNSRIKGVEDKAIKKIEQSFDYYFII